MLNRTIGRRDIEVRRRFHGGMKRGEKEEEEGKREKGV